MQMKERNNMENKELIERYIYAATKRLPSKSRKDVAEELRTLIEDMINERCGNETASEKDIRVVLTELGTPQELAEKYNPDEKKCLIGAPYYTTYKLVLKIVLICVFGGMIIAFMLRTLIGGTELTFFRFMEDVGAIYSALLQAMAILTIIFAIFEWKGVKLDKTGNLDELPPVPKNSLRIHPAECIISIAFGALITALFVLCPEVFCVLCWVGEESSVIPLFDANAISQLAPFILVFGAAGIVRDCVKLIERRYSTFVLATTLGTNIIGVFSAICWIRGNIFNDEFNSFMFNTFAESGGNIVFSDIDNFACFWLGVIIFALSLDTIETVVKAIRTRKEC